MEKKKITVSVVLATYNEEENIDHCLSSVAGIADEIVVVDGGSTDKTVEIARKHHARIVQTDNPAIFHINKQKALDAATGVWILQIDADEVATPELAKEILSVIRMSTRQLDDRVFDERKRRLFTTHQHLLEIRDGKIGDDTGSVAAFYIPRKNYFLGKLLTYAGTYPDGVIRLIKKGKAWFPAVNVHEQIHVDGAVRWLQNDLIHYSNPTISRYLTGADRYTSLLASDLKRKTEEGESVSVINYMIVKPLGTFLQLFFRHKGFLDSIHGFLFCLFSSLHFPAAYIKYLRMT